MKFMARLVVMAACVMLAAPALAGEYSFDSNGTEVHYMNHGTGDAVVLIHGYTSDSTVNWKYTGVMRLLEEDYRVIAMDVRGHGKTGPAADGKYGIESVHDIARLLDHLEIEKAHLVGYSMGGMMTIKFATLYPERVRSAVVGGMGWVDPGSMGERGESYANVSDTLAEVYDGFKEYETTAEEMQAIATPLTVIVGTEDHGQLRRIENWQGIVEDLPVVYVEGATHTSCVLRRPFKEALKSFIDANN